MKNYIQLHKLESNFIFHGWLDTNCIYKNNFSFVLNLSRWEGLPLSLLEAIYHDRIVIASNINGNRELLYNDYLFSSQDELINILRTMVIEEKPNIELLKSQKKYVYRNYNKKLSLDKFEKLIQNLLNDSI